jgi:hypothetical protein
LLAQNVTRVAPLVFTAQAEPLTVPRSVALLPGVVHDTVGAAWALREMAPQSAAAASAIGVLRGCFNGLSLLLYGDTQRVKSLRATRDLYPPVVRSTTKSRSRASGKKSRYFKCLLAACRYQHYESVVT